MIWFRDNQIEHHYRTRECNYIYTRGYSVNFLYASPKVNNSLEHG
jgi:hypothetical protein